MVVPAELLQVTYAGELREYLARKYSHLTLVTFRRLVFAGVQQEIVLLLATREDCSQSDIAFVELDSPADLSIAHVARTPDRSRLTSTTPARSGRSTTSARPSWR